MGSFLHFAKIGPDVLTAAGLRLRFSGQSDDLEIISHARAPEGHRPARTPSRSLRLCRRAARYHLRVAYPRLSSAALFVFGSHQTGDTLAPLAAASPARRLDSRRFAPSHHVAPRHFGQHLFSAGSLCLRRVGTNRRFHRHTSLKGDDRLRHAVDESASRAGAAGGPLFPDRGALLW